jgi:uncharacterized protein involved in exopolysaccharide biosynthesis
MNDTSFDLIGIFKEIFKKKIFILVITVAALIISIIFCSMQQKRYTSSTVFIVKNPLLIDRNYVFRTTSYEHREFFAIPDDVDHVKTIAKSDGLIWFLIDSFKLDKAYNMVGNPGLVEHVKDNFKAVMEDTKNIELFYTDPDQKRAMQITTAARQYIEKTFLNYFIATNKDITVALQEKSAELRDSIARMDESIKTLREATNNYSQLLPSRGMAVVAPNTAGNAQSAEAMEHLSEITIVKDKMSEDIAKYQSLINEYQVMANGKIKIFYVVQEAYMPGLPSHPKTLIVVAASTLAGLFFACILVLIGAFYRAVMNHQSKRRETAN